VRSLPNAVAPKQLTIGEHSAAIPSDRNQYTGIRQTGPATRHRIRAALRAALNIALTDGNVTTADLAHLNDVWIMTPSTDAAATVDKRI
jgi:hypothetical protein